MSRRGAYCGHGRRLEAARALFDRRAWSDAHAALVGADAEAGLGVDDLSASPFRLHARLDDEYVAVLERAHRGHLEAGETPRAVRCAFWIGLNLRRRRHRTGARLVRPRAGLLVEQADCVERGYLVIPAVLQHVAEGDPEAAHDAAAEAAAIASRFGDRDLLALAVHEQGHALVRLGRVEDGLRLMDETMVSVVAGSSRRVPRDRVLQHDRVLPRRLRVPPGTRVTEHLTRWCAEQPEMVAHTGVCLVHRAEIMELQGAWPDALEEAGSGPAVRGAQLGAAHPRPGAPIEGDLHPSGATRRRRDGVPRRGPCGTSPNRAWPSSASPRAPRRPQAAIHRALAGTSSRIDRALCPQLRRDRGRRRGRRRPEDACRQLGDRGAVAARSARRRGRACPREPPWPGGNPARRSPSCARPQAPGGRSRRRTSQPGHGRSSPWPARRSATDEAAPGARGRPRRSPGWAPPPTSRGEARGEYGLRARELEGLRRVAAGETNKAIAAELVLSERTVDRHVSNIFGKLRVTPGPRRRRARTSTGSSDPALGETTHA